VALDLAILGHGGAAPDPARILTAGLPPRPPPGKGEPSPDLSSHAVTAAGVAGARDRRNESAERRSLSAGVAGAEPQTVLAAALASSTLAVQNVRDPAKLSVQDPWLAAEPRHRMIAVEWRDAAREYWRLRTEEKLTRSEAEAVLSGQALRYPHLTVRGKGGRSALSARNLDGVLEKLGMKRGSGEPDWMAVANLLPGWTRCGRRGPEHDFAPFLQLYARQFETDRKLGHDFAFWLACGEARKQGLHEECICSAGQAERYYRTHVHRGSLFLARAGRRDEINGMKPKLLRDYSDLEPGDVFVADSHTLDLEVPYFDEEEREWKMGRPTLVGVQDVRSTRLVGWVVTMQPCNRFHVQQAFGMAVLEAGAVAPLLFYLDNGHDYNAQGLTDPVLWEGHAHSMVLDLGAEKKNALPFTPQSKPIERTFGTFAKQLPRLFPTWTGHRAGTRPDSSAVARKNPTGQPDLDDVTGCIAYYLRDWYHPRRKPNSLATGGLSPDEVWNARKVTRLPMAKEQFLLAMCLPEPEGRVVRPGGWIQFGNGIYRNEALLALVGRTVYIRRPLHMLQRILVCRADGTILCAADRQTATPFWARGEEQLAQLEAAIEESRRWFRNCRVIARERTGLLRSVPPPDPLALLIPDADRAELSDTLAQRLVAGTPSTPVPDPAPAVKVSADVQAAVRKALFGGQDIPDPIDATEPARDAGQADTTAAAPDTAGASAATDLHDALANLEL
jgi:hypothetical protein